MMVFCTCGCNAFEKFESPRSQGRLKISSRWRFMIVIFKTLDATETDLSRAIAFHLRSMVVSCLVVDLQHDFPLLLCGLLELANHRLMHWRSVIYWSVDIFR